MKFVLNKCFGGFGINKSWREEHCHDGCDGNCLECEKLIAAIENHEDVSDEYAELKVVHIPDSATDWEFDEYDGIESVIYVVDGKLNHA